jgi:glutamate-1-semialdehyde 2,1-aminomutase
VVPDLTTVGKALSAGLPLSALAGRRELMEHLDPRSDPARRSLHCGTLSGHLTAVEAAHASLDVLLDEGGVGVLAERSARLRELLHRTLRDAGVPAYVSGEGPVFRVWFTDREVRDAAQGRATDLALGDAVHRLMRQAGVYQPRSKSYVGLVHTDEHLLAYADALGWALARARDRSGGAAWTG